MQASAMWRCDKMSLPALQMRQYAPLKVRGNPSRAGGKAVIGDGRLSQYPLQLQGPAEEATAGGNVADAADVAAGEAFPGGMLTAFIDAAGPSQGSASQVHVRSLVLFNPVRWRRSRAACHQPTCTQAWRTRPVLTWIRFSAGPRTATRSVPRCSGKARVPRLRGHPGCHAGGGRRPTAARGRRGPASRRRR